MKKILLSILALGVFAISAETPKCDACEKEKPEQKAVKKEAAVKACDYNCGSTGAAATAKK
jgi:hypothetical protein